MIDSQKLKTLLKRKSLSVISKLKDIMKRDTVISVTTSILSMLFSGSIATTFLPNIAVSILSFYSVILTGITLKLKF